MRWEVGDIRVVPDSEVFPPHGSRRPLVVIREPSRDENLDNSHEPGRSQPQQMRKAVSVNTKQDLQNATVSNFDE